MPLKNRKNHDLKRRIIEISYPRKLSHLGSCLGMVDILEKIYSTKKPEDICILSAGHAGLALYVVLEKYGFGNAEELFDKHGVHPNRDVGHGIYCSAGSLGHGVGIALGMAVANPDKQVYCFSTDGEMAEGSIDEAMRYREEQEITNFKLYVNFNGFSAYKPVGPHPRKGRELRFLNGLDAHYHVMTEEEYKEAMRSYS